MKVLVSSGISVCETESMADNWQVKEMSSVQGLKLIEAGRVYVTYYLSLVFIFQRCHYCASLFSNVHSMLIGCFSLQLDSSSTSRPSPPRPNSLMLDNALTMEMEMVFSDMDNNNHLNRQKGSRKKKRRAADIPVKKFDGECLIIYHTSRTELTFVELCIIHCNINNCIYLLG